MRGRYLLAFVLFAVPALAQQIRLFGETGSEMEIAPANPDSSLNPGNVLGIRPLANSSDLTLFGDVAPEDKRWKLHMKLRGSGAWLEQPGSTARFDVDELNFKVALNSWLDLRIGRTIEKWGSGYAWNPTGVVNPRKDPTDPGDRRSLYRGVDEIAADIFVKGWNITALGIPEIAWTGRDGRRLISTGWATRGSGLIRGTDVALTASGGNGLPNSQGLSLAKVFGNALELHGEAAYVSDSARYLPGTGGLSVVRRPHAEVLLGGQYTFRSNVNIVAEYYHTGLGLNAQEWLGFRQFAQGAQQTLNQGDPSQLMLANAQFTPLGMSKGYTFVRAFWPILQNRIELQTIVITSLRDGSSVVQPGITWRLRRNWSVYCIQNEFTGNAGSEFAQIQIRRSTDIGIRYHFSFGEMAAHSR